MKIISKHKDYYDYLTGVYGIDEKMVYDRRTDGLEKPSEDIISPINKSTVTTHRFSICNRIYVVYQFENEFYHTIDERFELYHILKKRNIDKSFLVYRSWRRYNIKEDIKEGIEEKFEMDNYPSNINKAIRQPVLIQTTWENDSFKYEEVKDSRYFKDTSKKVHSYWRTPYLAEYGFPKWYPADEMYKQVVAFIGWLKDNPEIPNNQTNEEKIISNGFDLKTSFRDKK